MDNKVSLITGASRGIGKSVAEKFLNAGYKVVLIARSIDKLNEIVKKFPNQAFVLDIDLNDFNSATLITEFIKQHKFSIEYLINNAAQGNPICNISQINQDDFQSMLNINLITPVMLVKNLVSLMSENARILNISSGLAHYPLAHLGAYSISKAALYMFTQVLNKDLNSQNIFAGSCMPGVVDTEMQLLIRSSKFPNQEYFIDLYNNHKLASSEFTAKFIFWLITLTDNEFFMRKDWDIRDQSHHEFWCS